MKTLGLSFFIGTSLGAYYVSIMSTVSQKVKQHGGTIGDISRKSSNIYLRLSSILYWVSLD